MRRGVVVSLAGSPKVRASFLTHRFFCALVYVYIRIYPGGALLRRRAPSCRQSIRFGKWWESRRGAPAGRAGSADLRRGADRRQDPGRSGGPVRADPAAGLADRERGRGLATARACARRLPPSGRRGREMAGQVPPGSHLSPGAAIVSGLLPAAGDGSQRHRTARHVVDPHRPRAARQSADSEGCLPGAGRVEHPRSARRRRRPGARLAGECAATSSRP